MAEETSTPNTDPPNLAPIQVKPVGYSGLNISSGVILEECDPALRWPQCQYTYKQMLKDATVAVAVDAVVTKVSSAKFFIKAPAGHEEPLKDKVDILKSMIGDMKHSWLSFQQNAASFVPFGFATFEILPRKRLKKRSSKYNDGYWGIGKLALRPQDTISAVQYTEDFRDFTGFWQRVDKSTNKSPDGKFRARTVQINRTKENEVFLPIEKLLLFRNNPLKDSPFGSSPLVGCYESWKYKKAYEVNESHSVLSDVHGLKVLYIPPQYMKPDADPADASVFLEYQKIMRNVHIGKESGIILPQVLDDKGEQYFKFEVVSVAGSKAHNIGEIISRYKNDIITALYANSLVAGQEGGGSFALSESLIDIQNKVIEARLAEIRDVLNHKLIPLIFKWNNWETEVYPEFDFEKVGEETFDDKTKGIQRVGAVKLIPRTPKNVNAICEMLGLPDRVDEDMEQDALEKILGTPPEDTKAGAGMASGLNNGVGSSDGSSGDNSTSNSENK